MTYLRDIFPEFTYLQDIFPEFTYLQDILPEFTYLQDILPEFTYLQDIFPEFTYLQDIFPELKALIIMHVRQTSQLHIGKSNLQESTFSEILEMMQNNSILYM